VKIVTFFKFSALFDFGGR